MSGHFNPETKRILVIDGYAFRGIGPLYIIDRIVRNASFRAKKPLLPCDVFDLICGTSSGGLIAILLGRLGLDCGMALSEYKNLVRECCGNDEARLWQSVLANTEVKPHSYDTALASLIKRHTSLSDAPMLTPLDLNARNTNVSVVVTTGAPNHTGQAHCIRSYRGPTTMQPASHQWLIREAAYAALASPLYGYAPPTCLGNKYSYQDSAFFGFNNPIMFAQREQKLLWPNTKDVLIISLGTNIGSLVPLSVQSKWQCWSPNEAYCAPYVDRIITKFGNTITDAERRDAACTVKKLIYVSAETTGEHLKATTSLLQGFYYRIDPPTDLEPIAFADIFYEQAVKGCVDRWCEDTEGKNIMSNIVGSLVPEDIRPITVDNLRNLDPPPPPAGTVNEGYNPQLDKRRPTEVIEYLQRYHVLFIMDDSGSMTKLWDEAGSALAGIAQHALEYNARSVDLVFLNSERVCTQIQGKSVLLEVFKEVSPSGSTPTGAVLKKHLDKHISRLNATANNAKEYGKIAPLDIIVITDGRPDDRPEDVIGVAEKDIKAGKHHPNCIGIQFVQIGNDPGAQHALQNLSYNAAKVGMVDTVLYDGFLTSEKLERILLGGIHPSLRPLLPTT